MASRESTECKVYIGDLPKDAEEREIERAFGYYGHIKSVWVARNPSGFAFVEFNDPRDAEDAVRELDGRTLCGVRVRVEHATGKVRPKPWMRDGGRGGRGGGYGGYRGGGGGGGGRRPYDPSDRCFDCGERGHHSRDCQARRGGAKSSDDYRRKRSRTRSRSHDRRRSPSRSPSRSRS